MRAFTIAGVVGAWLLLAPPALAQQATSPAPQPGAAQHSTPAPSAESMGISLKGVRREAKELPPPKAAGTGMRYDFIVEVLGKRPPIEFFRDFDLSTKGGVRWGGVTHEEILAVTSPYWVNAMRNTGMTVPLQRSK